MKKDAGRWYGIAPTVLQHGLWPVAWIILKFFCRFRKYGRKNLKGVNRTHGVIFAANHASTWDPIVVNAGFRFLSEYLPLFFARDDDTNFQNKKEWSIIARLIFGMRWFFPAFGAFPVYRNQVDEEGKKDYAASFRNQIPLLKLRESVLIFPEGRRTKDGMLQKAKPGIGYLLYHANVTVVPVAISGTFNIRWWSFLLRRHTITVTFGPPIRRDDVPVFKDNPEPRIREYKEAADFIMVRIAELLPHNGNINNAAHS